MWLSSASLHMEGNAAWWMQVHKRRQGLGNWAQFTRAVQEKFEAEEDSQAMRGLLRLTQKASLEEYIHAFEEARYVDTLHNPALGEKNCVTVCEGFKRGVAGACDGPITSDSGSSNTVGSDTSRGDRNE